jgi:hypothetical protein
MAHKPKAPREPTAAASKPTLPDAPTDGRAMNLAKKGGVVVGLISGVVGLFFLLFPQYRPERQQPTADQTASVTGLVLNPRTTRGQFLDYSDQSKLGFTKEQLNLVGASAFARVQIVGYRGTTLTLERQLIDARTGNVVGQARDFLVTPPAEKVTHRWWDWTPLRQGRGSYIMVIKVLDEQQRAAVACGQSPPFDGADGSLPAQPLHLCEGQ